MNELYNNLMNLCKTEDKCFYSVDHISSFGTKFRVFSYHVAGLTQWMIPDAVECRGIMFEMDEHWNKPLRIASRPMEKFYNLAEVRAWNITESSIKTIQTPSLTVDSIDRYEDKADGSLMSSYMDWDPEDNTRVNYLLKSKTSIRSEQANDANKWLYDVEREDLMEFIIACEEAGYTVNFEWTSPKNQIVLAYEKPALVILNVRHRDTGEYFANNQLIRSDVFKKYGVKQFMLDPVVDVEDAIKTMYNQTGIEGYVFVTNEGQRFKLKTNWYVALHKTKDSINNNTQLVCSIVEGVSDDLRQMFIDDPQSLVKIEEFEQAVINEIGNTMSKLKEQYAKHAGMERKDYAIGMKNVFAQDQYYFGIAMKMYQNPDLLLVEEIGEVIKKYPEKFIPVKYR